MSNSRDVLNAGVKQWKLEQSETDERITRQQGFLATAGDAVLSLGASYPSGFPSQRVQLFSISQDKYVYATLDNKICMGQISDLLTGLLAIKDKKIDERFQASHEIVVEAPISHVALSHDAKQLYVSAAQGGLLVYSTDNLQQGRTEIIAPILVDLAPNPAGTSVALLDVDGNLSLYNDGVTQAIASDISAISWSKKGKQIIAGTTSGILKQFSPIGELKDELPAVNQEVGKVNALNWIENDLFVIAYENAQQEIALYILRREKSNDILRYTAIVNPSVSFGDTSHSPHFTFFQISKSLILTLSSVSADLGLVSLPHNAALEIDEEEQKAAVRFSTDRDIEVSIVGSGIAVDTINHAKYVWYMDNDGGCTVRQIRDDESTLFDEVMPATTSTAPVLFNSGTSSPSPFSGTTPNNASNNTLFADASTASPFQSGTVSPFQSASGTGTASPFNANTASPFKFSTLGTTPATGFGGAFSALSRTAESNTPLATFGAANSFGSSAFGSGNFATSAFTAHTAFKGFSSADTFGATGTTSSSNASIQGLKTEMVPKLRPAGGNPSDSEGEMDDDKLDDIDEQEPTLSNDTFDFDDGTRMSALDMEQSTTQVKGVMAETMKPQPQKPVSETTETPQVMAGNSTSSTFGSFAFPAAQFGGFGSTTDSAVDTSKTLSQTSPSKIVPPTFGNFNSFPSSKSVVKPAFGFGGGQVSFGFGDSSSQSRTASPSHQESGSMATPDSPQAAPEQLESSSQEDPSTSSVTSTVVHPSTTSEPHSSPKAQVDDGTSAIPRKQTSSPDKSQSARETKTQEISSSEGVEVKSTDEKRSEERSLAHQQTSATFKEEGAQDDELKKIPPFDFTSVETIATSDDSEAEKRNEEITETRDETRKHTPAADAPPDRKSAPSSKVDSDTREEFLESGADSSTDKQETKDDSRDSFANFSIEEHDSEYETEESEFGASSEVNDESSDRHEEVSDSDHESLFSAASQDSVQLGTSVKQNSRDASDGETSTASRFDAEEQSASAFAVKTPAFTSSIDQNPMKVSPFADFSQSSPFGSRTSVQATQPASKFNFAQAAEKGSLFAGQEAPKSSLQAPAFSFSPSPITKPTGPPTQSAPAFVFNPFSTVEVESSKGPERADLGSSNGTSSDVEAVTSTTKEAIEKPQEAPSFSTMFKVSGDAGKASTVSTAATLKSAAIDKVIVQEQQPQKEQNTKQKPANERDSEVISIKQAPRQEAVQYTRQEQSSSTDMSIEARTAQHQESKRRTLEIPEYSTLDAVQIESANESTIARDLHVLATTLTTELNVMSGNLDSMSEYLKESQELPQSLNNVKELVSEVDKTFEQARVHIEAYNTSESQLSAMRLSMLRLEAQKVKVQRLLRAQTDSSFAKSLNFSALGPEHAMQQKKVRQLLGQVEEDLTKVQSSLSLIKARSNATRPIAPMPTAETITRASAKIMRVAIQREREVEDLQKAFVTLQMASSPDASFRSSTTMHHRSRDSRSRISIDDTFDLSLSRLSLSQSGTNDSKGDLHRGVLNHGNLRAIGDQKRRAMQIYQEARAKGSAIKTLPM